MTEVLCSPLPAAEQEALLREVKERLWLEGGALTQLESYRSDVYLHERGPDKSVVKLLHWRHRTHSEIEGELWWLFFLRSHGVSVALPLPSPSGRLIETFDTEWGPYYAVRFEFATGAVLQWENLTESVAELWGETVGRLHALSRAHSRCLPARRVWIEEANYDLAAFAQEHEAERIAATSLIRDVMSLPRTIESFGLIHADLHPGNLRLDGPKLIVLDADSSVYHWYLYDFAVMLHEMKKIEANERVRKEFTEFFMRAALRGYRRHCSLTEAGDEATEKLELFLELEQLGSIALSLKMGRFPSEVVDPVRRLEEMREALRNRTPPLRVPTCVWSGE